MRYSLVRERGRPGSRPRSSRVALLSRSQRSASRSLEGCAGLAQELGQAEIVECLEGEAFGADGAGMVVGQGVEADGGGEDLGLGGQ